MTSEAFPPIDPADLRPPLALPGMRIGLLGGSFNPPHMAHVLITQTALKKLQLSQVWWIVTPGNPLKNHDNLAPLAERIALCRKSTDTPIIKITAFEQSLNTAYTAQTLRFLTAHHPQTHFVWLMGADNLTGFHRWNHWADIFAMMPIAVADRPRWRYKALSSPAAHRFGKYQLNEQFAPRLPLLKTPAWCFLSGPLSDLSSTALRNGKAKHADD